MLGTLIQLGEEKVLLQHMHGMASSFLDNNKEQLRVVKTSGLSGDDDDETTMDGGCDELNLEQLSAWNPHFPKIQTNWNSCSQTKIHAHNFKYMQTAVHLNVSHFVSKFNDIAASI